MPACCKKSARSRRLTIKARKAAFKNLAKNQKVKPKKAAAKKTPPKKAKPKKVAPCRACGKA